MTDSQMNARNKVCHGGQWQDYGRKPTVDLSVNDNPLGMPRQVRRYLEFGEMNWEEYPEISTAGKNIVKDALSKAHYLDPEQLYVSSGCTSILVDVLRFVNQKKRISKVWTLSPTYSGYEEVCHKENYDFQEMKQNDMGFFLGSSGWNSISLQPRDVFILGNPNSPVGELINPRDVIKKAQDFPESTIVVDESYIDFLPHFKSTSLCGYFYHQNTTLWPSNLWVVKSLTKFFAIPGVRLGIAYGGRSNIQGLEAKQMPWDMNRAAQCVAPLLYQDKEFLAKTRELLPKWKQYFLDTYHQWKQETHKKSREDLLNIYVSPANFFWIELREKTWNERYSAIDTMDSLSQWLQKKLFVQGVGVRAYPKSSVWKNYIRIRVGTPEEQESFFHGLECVWNDTSDRVPSHKKQQNQKNQSRSRSAIMVVGTSSGAGKSLVTTAICRMLYNKGYKVAPFKGQNMSNNAAVTKEGLEMGRAQYVQAQAAGVEPHVDMNPVLLKPSGTKGCQVVVCGEVVGNQSVQEYYEETSFESLRKQAHEAYARLERKWDVIVLEGAGSPAEINLETKDFTNLDMAVHTGASVILVADIERGGVFASIFGTIRLLQPHHRKTIQGIIINKFRGDVSLLKPGIEEIEHVLKIPVLGVLPWEDKWNLEEEDSLDLANKETELLHPMMRGVGLDLVVIHLPHISNHTDFQPFEQEYQVSIRYVQEVEQLGNPDLILLPGSKNVVEDLLFLKRLGWDKALTAAAERKIPIMGICGGYQMLGQAILDPEAIEGTKENSTEEGNNKGYYLGLDLLPIKSTFYPQKKRVQVHGVSKKFPFVPSGTAYTGYEIHCGQTEYHGEVPLEESHILEGSSVSMVEDPIGTDMVGVQKDKLIWGCYIHGIFEQSNFRKIFIESLWKRKGLSPPSKKGLQQSGKYSSQETIQYAAHALEKYVDTHKIESWCKETSSNKEGVSSL